LIEKYHNEVIKCIKLIYFSKTAKLSLQQKLTFFAETRHSFGHTALMLSGGATFGKFHFGLLKALYDYDLMPRTMCGSSIGSLVSAAICSKPYEEMGVS
jgi:predicted acylesterase/phospholipase RssA